MVEPKTKTTTKTRRNYRSLFSLCISIRVFVQCGGINNRGNKNQPDKEVEMSDKMAKRIKLILRTMTIATLTE